MRPPSRVSSPTVANVAASVTLLVASYLFRLPPLLNARSTNSDAAVVGLQAMHILRGEHSEDRVDQGSLADAGAAGDHQDLGEEGQPQCRALALGERDPGPGLDPWERFRRIDVRPGKDTVLKDSDAARDGALGSMEAGQENAAPAVDLV